MSLKSHRRDWEELATVDAKWSVLTNPGKRTSWGDSEFFATGECEVGQLIQTLQGLSYPKLFKNALDFGCGVGRLTLPLSQRFENTWGIDISAPMLEQAKANVPRAFFAKRFKSSTVRGWHLRPCLHGNGSPASAASAPYIRLHCRISQGYR